jgi:hypothetical protein
MFSVLCVLFVCKCVLYCCHRVSTELRLNMYHIIYHINEMYKLNQYGITTVTHFSFSLLRIKTSTCFEHYLLILRRCTSGTWNNACVLC